MREQLEKLAPLDLDILAGMGDDEKVTEDDMANEIEESSRLSSNLKSKLSAIEELLAGQHEQVPQVPQYQSSPPPVLTGQETQPKSSVRARLPKLEMRKFDGKIHEVAGILGQLRERHPQE